jgi:hypothetical protein
VEERFFDDGGGDIAGGGVARVVGEVLGGFLVRARVDVVSDGPRADSPVSAHEVDKRLAESLPTRFVRAREGGVQDQVADPLRMRRGVNDRRRAVVRPGEDASLLEADVVDDGL